MDTTLIHADVFFFVSTILFSILAVLFIVAIGYAISIMSEVKRVTRLVREQSEKFAEDMNFAREKIRDAGFTPKGLFSIAAALWKKRKKKGGK